MVNCIRVAVVLSLGLCLTACSSLFGEKGLFRDRGEDYRAAHLEPVLQVPDNVDESAIDDRYAVPPVQQELSLEGEFVVPRPQPMDEVLQANTVRINRLNDQQWILANVNPGQIWPRLRGFLNLNTITVARADAANGLLETAWLQPSGGELPRERFRFRVEQGVQRNTSEVHVLQMHRNVDNQWPRVSDNSDREDLMIKELAQYLADSAAAASVSMLAQRGMTSQSKIKVVEDPALGPVIRLQLPFVRAWASLGLALEKANFQIEDRNRDQGLYYTRYVEQRDEEPGFFARLFSSREELEGVNYLITIEPSSTNSDEMIISLKREDEQPMDAETAQSLILAIKRNLA